MSYLFWMSYVVLWIVAVVLIIAVLLIIRQIGLVYLNTSDGISRSGLRIGSAVPDISIRTLEGEDIRLSSLASRLPLLVFTSPRCATCKTLLPHLSRFIDRYRDIPVILFSMDATPDEVMAFVSGHDLNCTIVPLPTNELYVKVFEGHVTPFAFRLNDKLQVLNKGLVNDFEDLQHVAGLISSAPRVAASAS